MTTTHKTKNAGANQRTLTGQVVSTKMKDTIVVAVDRFVKHPKYHKFQSSIKRYHVHDAGNTASMGDTVTIVETKPMSRKKRFTLQK